MEGGKEGGREGEGKREREGGLLHYLLNNMQSQRTVS